MSDFSKGPWIIEHGLPGVERGYASISSEDHTALAEVVWKIIDDSIDGRDSRRCQANARLISAAPDLYSALENLIKEVDCFDITPSQDVDSLIKAVQSAEDALAKANGEEYD